MTFSKITKYSIQVWFLVNVVMGITNFILQALLFSQVTFFLDIFLANLLTTLIMSSISIFFIKKSVLIILKKDVIDNIKKLLLMVIGIILFMLSNFLLTLFLIGVTGSLVGLISSIDMISVVISFLLVITLLPLPPLPKGQLETIDHLIDN